MASVLDKWLDGIEEGWAIPAMLGSYFLKWKIKDVSNDMQVFSDEFVTKIAETYSSASGVLDALALEHR